jgi:glycosyltransferase involved in cell wall biosynthesis
MSTTEEITLNLIATCKGRLAHLKQSLGPASQQAHAKSIIVDFSCPENTREWVKQNYPNVDVVYVPNRERFQIAGARNAGGFAATAPWIFFLDADTILEPNFSTNLIPMLEPGNYYRPDTNIEELFGVCAVRREDFHKIGGYDDAIQGYGVEDDDFYERLKASGLKEVRFPLNWLRTIPHENKLRTQHYVIKEHWVSVLINRLYVQVKKDVAKMAGHELNAEDRHNLHARATNWVQKYLKNPKADSQFNVSFRRLIIPGIGGFDSAFFYTLRPRDIAEAMANTVKSRPDPGSQPPGVKPS